MKKFSEVFSTAENRLNAPGWKNVSLGQFRSNGSVKEKDGFELYVRRQNLNGALTNTEKQSSLSDPANLHEQRVPEVGGKTTFSSSIEYSAPTESRTAGILSSLRLAAGSRTTDTCIPTLTIAVSCLLTDHGASRADASRKSQSWSFSTVDNDELVDIVVLGYDDKKVSFEDGLSYVLDNLTSIKAIDTRSVDHYKYCTDQDGNRKIRTTNDRNVAVQNNIGNYKIRKDYSRVARTQINLVFHNALEGLCSFVHKKYTNIFRMLIDKKSCASINGLNYEPVSYLNPNNTHVYPVSIRVYDTRCYCPKDHDELDDLAAAVNYKIPADHTQDEADTQSFRDHELKSFLDYASSGSTVPLLYVSEIFGVNRNLPVTLNSVTEKIFKQSIMESLGCSTEEEYERVYRGMRKIDLGIQKNEEKFSNRWSMLPINHEAEMVQMFARNAYRGGYNMCSEVGYFPSISYDVDLKGAYPTAMCLVPDINWEDPIEEEVKDRDLTLADFEAKGRTPLSPFVGCVDFEFPDGCEYPSIPVYVSDSLIYPLSSNDVYAAGPALYLALKLHAKVRCHLGFFLRVLEKDGKPSYSLRSAVKPLVKRRAEAKEQFGEDSLNELVFKGLANGGYGKIAQGIKDKLTYSVLANQMEKAKPSTISNSVAAAMITSIVQAVLIAALNQTRDRWFTACSATTDGFITSCPMEILSTLDLYGLRKYVVEARKILTDGKDDEIWAVKHVQDDLLNFTTRGNVSLHDKVKNPFVFECKECEGVCAHNGIKSGKRSDSYEDRKWLMCAVLSRTKMVDYHEKETPSLKKVIKNHQYNQVDKAKHKSMDFDLKRKPVRDSFHTDEVVIEGQTYTIAHFRTEPFRDIAEYEEYVQRKKKCKVLRTEKDWNFFFQDKTTNRSSSTDFLTSDREWKILLSCIMGYRANKWDIPELNDKSVEEKCKWINAHNSSAKKFTGNAWKDARRPERQKQMLSYEDIKDKLDEMNAVVIDNTKEEKSL